MDALKPTGKQVGLAALNLAFVLLVLFGAQSLLRGHISKTANLAILSLLVFGAYLLGYGFIERFFTRAYQKLLVCHEMAGVRLQH